MAYGEDGSMEDSRPGRFHHAGQGHGGAAFALPVESKLLEARNLLMLKSELVPSTWKLRTVPASLPVLCVMLAGLALPLSAVGQQENFSLQIQQGGFNPPAVDPGGSASVNVTLVGINSFSGTVDLSCQVTPQQTAPATTPQCLVSPTSQTPPNGVSVTVTTQTSTPPLLYTITITGTATINGNPVSNSVQPDLPVLAVPPDFTITVEKAVEPSSVHAGSGGQGTISVNPIGSYSGSVTLSCVSVTPLVTVPPVCSFNPPVVTVNGASATSIISISTTGPVTTLAVRSRQWYALWLPLPLLALGAVRGKRSRRALCLLAVLMMAGAFLLMPACANNKTTTTTATGVTPNNTYTFTLMGVDANGVPSSNTGTTSSPTVSLQVD